MSSSSDEEGLFGDKTTADGYDEPNDGNPPQSQQSQDMDDEDEDEESPSDDGEVEGDSDDEGGDSSEESDGTGNGEPEGDDEDEMDVDEEDADGGESSQGGAQEPTFHTQPLRSPLEPIPQNLIRRALFKPSFDPRSPPKSLSLDPFVSIPHPVATHALAASACLSYLLTGSQDGYVRSYDFWASANGKSIMTAAARGVANLGDGVTKGGVARGYWKHEVEVEEVEEPEQHHRKKQKSATGTATPADHTENEGPKVIRRMRLDPVHSLAMQGDGLWSLAGTTSGAINLTTVRHAPGTIAHVLRGHTATVSTLSLLPDEKSVISGSWDKTIKEWDLNTGQIVREFTPHGAHISAVQLRPTAFAPSVPSAAGSPVSGTNSVTVSFGSKTKSAATESLGASIAEEDSTGHKEEIAEESTDPKHSMDVVEEDDDAKSDLGSLFGDSEGVPTPMAAGNIQQDTLPLIPPASTSTNPLGTSFLNNPFAISNPFDAPSVPESRPPSTKPKTPRRRSSMAKKSGGETDQEDESPSKAGPAPRFAAAAPAAKLSKAGLPTLSPATYSEYSDDVMLVASIDGQVALHDRRMHNSLAGRLETTDRTPPWCMSACWSSDGAQVIAGRRQNTVDVWDVRKMGRTGSTSTPTLLRSLKNPAGSGPVSCVAAFPDGRNIACASHDTLRLWNTAELWNGEGSLRKTKSGVPFRIAAGHRSGTVSSILIDPTCRFLITASGDRGWSGDSTHTVLIHEVKMVQ